MHICIQIILCNVHTDANGQVRSWRKWDGATEWELMHEKLDSKADQPDAITGIDGIRRGYLMGWANTGMDVSQEWLIDDFKLSTASLL